MKGFGLFDVAVHSMGFKYQFLPETIKTWGGSLLLYATARKGETLQALSSFRENVSVLQRLQFLDDQALDIPVEDGMGLYGKLEIAV